MCTKRYKARHHKPAKPVKMVDPKIKSKNEKTTTEKYDEAYRKILKNAKRGKKL